jgi:hypothetical protein
MLFTVLPKLMTPVPALMTLLPTSVTALLKVIGPLLVEMLLAIVVGPVTVRLLNAPTLPTAPPKITLPPLRVRSTGPPAKV